MCPISSDFSKLVMTTQKKLVITKIENWSTRVRARVLTTKKSWSTRALSLFKREERGKYLNDFPSLDTCKKQPARAGRLTRRTNMGKPT